MKKKEAYKTKKRNIFKITISLIVIVFIFSGIPSNIFNNYIKRDTIRVVVNPLILNGLYYYEIKPNGKMTAYFVRIKGIDTKISSFNFNIKTVEKHKKILSKEEYENIFALADKSIVYGNIEEDMALDGCYCELYYKGTMQRIYDATNDYDQLYKLFIKITSLPPEFIDIKTQIPGIASYTY